MDRGDRARIRAYLLRRLSEDEREAFEARLLEERDLLHAVRETEANLLHAGVASVTRLRAICASCFLGGLVAGVLLSEVIGRLLA